MYVVGTVALVHNTPQYLHNLIEEIRKKAIALEKRNWTIIFTWITAHVRIYAKELARKSVKEADRKDDRSPKRTIVQEV
jgi:hypothetical protein